MAAFLAAIELYITIAALKTPWFEITMKENEIDLDLIQKRHSFYFKECCGEEKSASFPPIFDWEGRDPVQFWKLEFAVVSRRGGFKEYFDWKISMTKDQEGFCKLFGLI